VVRQFRHNTLYLPGSKLIQYVHVRNYRLKKLYEYISLKRSTVYKNRYSKPQNVGILPLVSFNLILSLCNLFPHQHSIFFHITILKKLCGFLGWPCWDIDPFFILSYKIYNKRLQTIYCFRKCLKCDQIHIADIHDFYRTLY